MFVPVEEGTVLILSGKGLCPNNRFEAQPHNTKISVVPSILKSISGRERNQIVFTNISSVQVGFVAHLYQKSV